MTPRVAQGPPKPPQGSPKGSEREPRGAFEGPKGFPREPLVTPWGPNGSKRVPKGAFKGRMGPRECLRGSERVPKEAQKGPKGSPREPSRVRKGPQGRLRGSERVPQGAFGGPKGPTRDNTKRTRNKPRLPPGRLRPTGVLDLVSLVLFSLPPSTSSLSSFASLLSVVRHPKFPISQSEFRCFFSFFKHKIIAFRLKNHCLPLQKAPIWIYPQIRRAVGPEAC